MPSPGPGAPAHHATIRQARVRLPGPQRGGDRGPVKRRRLAGPGGGLEDRLAPGPADWRHFGHVPDHQPHAGHRDLFHALDHPQRERERWHEPDLLAHWRHCRGHRLRRVRRVRHGHSAERRRAQLPPVRIPQAQVPHRVHVRGASAAAGPSGGECQCGGPVLHPGWRREDDRVELKGRRRRHHLSGPVYARVPAQVGPAPSELAWPVQGGDSAADRSCRVCRTGWAHQDPTAAQLSHGV